MQNIIEDTDLYISDEVIERALLKKQQLYQKDIYNAFRILSLHKIMGKYTPTELVMK